MAERFTTGIRKLDPLVGGGFVRGGTVSIQHSEPLVADMLAARLGVNVFDSLLSLTALHRTGLTEAVVAEALAAMDVSLARLLGNDQLFVLDGHASWGDQRNVFPITDGDDVRHAVETALDTARSRGMAHLVDVETLIGLVGREEAWELQRWYEGTLRGNRDLLLDFLHRPPLTQADVDRYTDRADHVIVVAGEGDDLHLTVEKSPGGEIGTARRIERLDRPPYVRLAE